MMTTKTFHSEPFLLEQPIGEELSTPTSMLQDATVQECSPFLLDAANSFLHARDHTQFCFEVFDELPAPYVGYDASRPWLFYWSLLSLYLLGEDVTALDERLINSLRPLQNSTGGVGGGQGHISHLACTYAAILALAMVGGGDAQSLLDKDKTWQWLGKLKQANGGFRVCEDGEQDVRGAYCALVLISLLGLPWKMPEDSPARAQGLNDFRDNLGEYLSTCQTYEGGISAGPGNEAHGAYTFCALACLCILDQPHISVPRYLNLDKLLAWLTARQYAPEGGLAGRTNKVVDGCYSHWIGGCWPLVEAALRPPQHNDHSTQSETGSRIFDTSSLMKYILRCCQDPEGGLRDKPSKRPDAYHTCYNLCGLSMLNNPQDCETDFNDHGGKAPLVWSRRRVGGTETAIPPTSETMTTADIPAIDPVYVIPARAVQSLHEYSCFRPMLQAE